MKRTSITKICSWIKTLRDAKKEKAVLKSFKECGTDNILNGIKDITNEESESSNRNAFEGFEDDSEGEKFDSKNPNREDETQIFDLDREIQSYLYTMV